MSATDLLTLDTVAARLSVSVDSVRRHVLPHGSIPASAGEPGRRWSIRSASRVDPRVRGGAAACVAARRRTAGRSPRPRGSRVTHWNLNPSVAPRRSPKRLCRA